VAVFCIVWFLLFDLLKPDILSSSFFDACIFGNIQSKIDTNRGYFTFCPDFETSFSKNIEPECCLFIHLEKIASKDL